MKKYLVIILSFFMFGFTISTTKLAFIEESNLKSVENGVLREEIIGTTFTDNGLRGKQNINILRQTEGIEVVNWSKMENGIFTRATTVQIAENFEKVHPEFEVVAGVNGDFFNMNRSEVKTNSASVLYGNRTIKALNEVSSYSVEFNLDGSLVDSYRYVNFNKSLSFEIYDENNSLKYKTSINDINSRELKDEETTYLENSDHVFDEQTTYYQVSKPIETVETNIVFKEFNLKNQTTSIDYNNVLATRDQNLINLINYNDRVVIQSTMNKANYNSMFIGVSGQILKDSNVRKYKDMSPRKDQFMQTRHPRSGFGFDENNKMVLFTVDGRVSGDRDGVNLRELAEVMKSIVNGYNLDGGGSTQAVFKKDGKLEYINKGPTSDKRSNANALLFVKRKAPKLPIEIVEINNGLSMIIDLRENDLYKKIEVLKNGVSHFYENLNEIVEVDLRENEYASISIVGYPKDSNNKGIILYNNYLKQVIKLII